MSETRETHQQETAEAQGEGGGDGGVAQVEQEQQVGGGDDVDGPARPGEDDQIQQQQGVPQGRQGEQQEGARWYKRKIRKVKSLFLLPFRNIKKFYLRRCPSAYYYYGDDPGGCCCRCLRPPPAISPPRFTNPGNPGRKNPNTSSYEFVKYLIESNDFYAPQCDVHGGASRCPHKAGDEE